MVDVVLRTQVERMASDIDPLTLEDFFTRMDDDYFSAFSPEEIHTHMRMSCALDQGNFVEFRFKQLTGGRIGLIIVAFDYFAELSIICGLLASFGLDIESGDIYTFSRGSAQPVGRHRRNRPSPNKIVDVFTLRVAVGAAFGEAEQEAFDLELAKLVGLLAAGSVEEARDSLNRRLVERLESVGNRLAGLLYPVEIKFDNDPSDRWTVMDVQSFDTPAFLYAFSNALAMRGIYIHKVRIRSVGNRVSDRFFISDRRGQKLESDRDLQTLRIAVVLIKRFTHFLYGAPDPARAIRYFDQLLDRVYEHSTRESVISFFQQEGSLTVLARILGSSDFLWEDFLRMQGDHLFALIEELDKRELRSDRDQTRARLRTRLSKCDGYQEMKIALNEFKDREVFLIDMKHVLAPEEGLTPFSAALTDLAEVILDEACRICGQHLSEKYGSPGCAFAICGLGKFGGREMGYASDLELLFVYDDRGTTTEGSALDAGEYFERLATELVDFVEARREGTFHIDLRLRPYGKAGRLANSIERLESYYSTSGDADPFERQALIKLRQVAGDGKLARRVEAHRDRYVYSGEPWDLETALHVRQRQVNELVKPGLVNVKYSLGGLIDIEYAVQYLQIVHGAEHPVLRTPTTMVAMERLRELGILKPDEYDLLGNAYVFQRLLIDALRIVRGNASDLILPTEGSDEFTFLARRMGYFEEDWSASASKLSEDIQHHRRLVNRFFVERFDPSRRYIGLVV